MPFDFRATCDIGPVLRRIAGLKQGKQNAILRRAATKSARVIVRNVKALAPVDTSSAGIKIRGLYKKSIGSKVVTYGTGKVVAIIGARRKMKQVTRITKKGKEIVQNPAVISHLLEKGHGGPSPAPAKPHLRPGWEQSKEAVKRIYADEINAGVNKLFRG